MGIILAIGDLEKEDFDWSTDDIVTKKQIEGEGSNRFAITYGAFEDELRNAELYEYFWGPLSDKETGRHTPICHEHPGVTPLLQCDVDLFNEVRDDLFEPSQLIDWLSFWSTWALENTTTPVIMNC